MRIPRPIDQADAGIDLILLVAVRLTWSRLFATIIWRASTLFRFNKSLICCLVCYVIAIIESKSAICSRVSNKLVVNMWRKIYSTVNESDCKHNIVYTTLPFSGRWVKMIGRCGGTNVEASEPCWICCSLQGVKCFAASEPATQRHEGKPPNRFSKSTKKVTCYTVLRWLVTQGQRWHINIWSWITALVLVGKGDSFKSAFSLVEVNLYIYSSGGTKNCSGTLQTNDHRYSWFTEVHWVMATIWHLKEYEWGMFPEGTYRCYLILKPNSHFCRLRKRRDGVRGRKNPGRSELCVASKQLSSRVLSLRKD